MNHERNRASAVSPVFSSDFHQRRRFGDVPLEAPALNTDTNGYGGFRGMQNGRLRFMANSGGGQPKWEAFTKVPPGGSKALLTKAHAANMPLKPIEDLIANQTPGCVSPPQWRTSSED